MATIHQGRYSAEIEGDFVVFLIGMRLNRPWKVHHWWPVFTAMPRMLRELRRHPEQGLLGARLALIGGPTVVQCSTGAASSTWTASPATRPPSTCRPGGGTTGR